MLPFYQSPLPSKLLLPLNESTKLIHTQLRKSLEFEDQGNLHNQIEKKVKFLLMILLFT